MLMLMIIFFISFRESDSNGKSFCW